MEISKIEWDKNLLNYERSRPMYSPEIHDHLGIVLGKENVIENDVYARFLSEFRSWIESSKLNKLIGLAGFSVERIIRGVTHALDDLHATHGERLVVLPDEYKYHIRINENQRVLEFKKWRKGDVAIISYPFSHTGNEPENWRQITDHCENQGIPIHIDAAWYGICRKIELDLSSSCIESISFSLSKPLGLGNYPIGVRFQRRPLKGPVETVNQFKMISPLMVHIGLRFIKSFPIDFFQNKYYEAYKIVAQKFGLQESCSIHVALEKKNDLLVPVGVRGFLRQIVEGKFR
jgi:hypothetical protein